MASATPHTKVVYDPAEDDFLLSTPSDAATKFPPNVGLDGVAKWAVVTARLTVADADCGAFLFLVRIRDEDGPRPGVHIKPLPPTSLLPMDYACVHFDQVRLHRRQWLRDSASISAGGVFHDPLDGPPGHSAGSPRSASRGAPTAWDSLRPPGPVWPPPSLTPTAG